MESLIQQNVSYAGDSDARVKDEPILHVVVPSHPDVYQLEEPGQLRRTAIFHEALKRAFDIAGAILGIILFFPIGVLIALLIKFDSRGPLFYTQRRLGDHGPLDMIKFRSMRSDADALLEEILAQDPAARAEYERFHKLENDPRVTRIGRFLRKYSLDEFPQFINVLRGEMSLVGPRPYMPVERAQMGDAYPVILRVKPGLTGLWQTQGRNLLTFKKRLDLDIEYVQSHNLLMDLKLIVLTIPVLFRGEGAS